MLASRDLITTVRGTSGGSFVSHADADQVSAFLETSIGLMSGSSDVSLDQMLEARELVEVPGARRPRPGVRRAPPRTPSR